MKTRRRVLVIVTCVFVLLVAIAAALVRAQQKATRLPANSPAAYLEAIAQGTRSIDPDQIVVACLGDSLTHGAVSANYVTLLEERFDDSRYTFVNAGVNSNLAYNLLIRLDEIIACQPDIVTILIGSNDVNSRISEANYERYVRNMGIPQVPDAAWFRQNLEEIVARLRNETDARIALLSLPPIGEDPSVPAFAWTGDYSQIISDVAREAGVVYLPLRERILEYLAENPSTPEIPVEESRSAVYGNILRHYVFGQDYTRISRANGMVLLVENLHLNEIGGAMVADLIADFIRDAE